MQLLEHLSLSTTPSSTAVVCPATQLQFYSCIEDDMVKRRSMLRLSGLICRTTRPQWQGVSWTPPERSIQRAASASAQ